MTVNNQLNNDYTLNIRNEFKEQDNKSISVAYHISSTTINLQVLNLLKYSELIQEEILSQDILLRIGCKINEIQKNLNIDEKHFTSFLKLLNEEDVSIDNNSFYDLSKLSIIFKVKSIQNALIQYSQNHSNDIDSILKLIEERDLNPNEFIFYNDKIHNDLENLLIVNINQCFQNEKFGNLPISTIHRIISKCDKKDIDHDLLYQFIKKSIGKRYILFAFLELKKMKAEKVDEFYNDYEIETQNENGFYYQYLFNDIIYQKKLRDEKKLIEEKMKELSEAYQQLDKKFKSIEIENRQMQAQIKKLDEDKTKSQLKIQTLENKNDQAQAQIQTLENKNNQAQAQIQSLENKNNQAQALVQTLENKNKQAQALVQSLENKNKQAQALVQNFKAGNVVKNIAFDNNSSHRFKGIISYIANDNPEKALSDGTINIISSSEDLPKVNIIKFNSRSVFYSKDEPESWICIDFKQKKVKLTDYSLSSSNGSSVGCENPQSWNIEGSNDLNQWKILDKKNKDKSLDGCGISKTFKVSPNENSVHFYRYIRLLQTEINTGQNNRLKIDSFELFGDILQT